MFNFEFKPRTSYPEVYFQDKDMGKLSLAVGKYDTEEDEPLMYYIGIFDTDDFEIQYDSLSYQHVLDVFNVISKHKDREDFITYFRKCCEDAYLVDTLAQN